MAAGASDFKSHALWKKFLLSWTSGGADYVSRWLNGWCFDPIAVMPFFFLLVLWVAHSLDPDAVTASWAMLVALSPLTLPVGMFRVFWVAWIHYIRFAFWFSPTCDSVLLKIELPPEVEKTPVAMEIFLASLWNTGGETTFRHRVWRGQTRPVFSLEIASTEGRVNFYIHTRKVWRAIVEARLYGQYPEARVVEVEDYASKIPFDLSKYGYWGAEYSKKIKPAALPIHTYVDFGLDKSPDKPETQTDPITNIIEFLGTMGKGEHFWLQIIIKGRKQDEWYGFYKKYDHYKEPAKKAIQDVTMGAIRRARELTEDEAGKKRVGERGAMLMTEMEKRKVEAIERSMAKLTYECGIRTIYLAERAHYNGINNSSVIRFFDTFNTNQEYTNRINVERGSSMFDYPWQDFMEMRQDKVKHNLHFFYKHRAYFFVPYDQVPVFMNPEELATLWHFPSSVVKSPSLTRVPAKVSEAPTNLPTGA